MSVLLYLLLLLGPSPDASDPVNAVLGDESWVERFGAPPGPGADDDERIAVHLRYVEDRLRAAPRSALGPIAKERRRAALDALARYREQRRFPVRTGDGHPGRRPRFIDDEGRRCAVAELIVASGHEALAEAFDAEHELDYLLEVDVPALQDWADAHGFSMRELAMIQPTYPPPDPFLSAIRPHGTEATLACQKEPAVPKTVEVEVSQSGGRISVRPAGPRPSAFARCYAEQLDALSVPATDPAPKPRYSVAVRSTEQLLKARVAGVRACGKPRHNTRVTVAAQTGPSGVTFEITSTPSDASVQACVEKQANLALAPFKGKRLVVASAERGEWLAGSTNSTGASVRRLAERCQSEVESRSSGRAFAIVSRTRSGAKTATTGGEDWARCMDNALPEASPTLPEGDAVGLVRSGRSWILINHHWMLTMLTEAAAGPDRNLAEVLMQ